RWFDELWNKKNYDIVYEYVAPGFTAHGAGGQDIKMGPEGPRDMVKAWHAAMPDGRMTIDDVITEGDLSTIRMTWRGTHTGAFGDIPPSGNKIEVTSIGIDRVVNGKITEGWGELNMLGMMQQMGAIPGPQAGKPASPEEERVNRNREVIHRFYSAVNTKQREVFYEIVHPNFVNHGGASGDTVGPTALIDSFNPFYEAMSDWHVSEDYVVAQGDRVASRGTNTGTHTGSFMGFPPTGKKLSWTGIIIYRLDEDGKVIERWQDFDTLGMLTQMGIIPPMG
ncbi:MAG: ester cyclase, partial [Chloroflexota bacterium]